MLLSAISSGCWIYKNQHQQQQHKKKSSNNNECREKGEWKDREQKYDLRIFIDYFRLVWIEQESVYRVSVIGVLCVYILSVSRGSQHSLRVVCSAVR